MIWHILKKDWKLLRNATLAVAGLQVAFAIIQLKSELGMGNPIIQQFGTLLMMLWLIASVILIVMLVQQDAIPGTRQDWLIRPIHRRDVVLAKIIFATAAVQGATLAGDLIQGLGSGFPLTQTVVAAFARAALGFVAITLPALVLGALTQSIAEAMVMSVVLLGGAFLFTVMATAIAGDTHQFDPTNTTGVEWIPNLLRYALILVSILVVLAWQYRTRRTYQGRLAAAIILLVVLCSQVMPWTPVFALEKTLSNQPGAAKEISIIWGEKTPDSHTGAATDQGSSAQAQVNDGLHATLPLRVSGVPGNAVLKEDKAEIQFFDPSGKSLYRGDGDDIEIRHEDGSASSDRFTQTVKLPGSLVREHGASSVKVRATYSMTLFTLRNSYAMKAMNDDQMLAGWGRCRTRLDGANSAVEMVCLQIGKGPTCATVFLEDPHSGGRNRVNTACYPNYSPYLERPIPDATSHFRLVLPYRDPAGLIKYPVDASHLAESQIRIRVYEPVDHFTRDVTSPYVTVKELVK